MPVITGQIDSFGVPTNARDVSKAFYMIKKEESPLLNLIEIPGVAGNTKHYWWDDARQIAKTALTAAHVSASGTFTVASTKGLRVGSIVSVAGIAYQVTAVSSDTVITVSLLSAADAAAASGLEMQFHGTAAKEGKDYEDTDYTPEVERMNVTQIFDDFLKITGTERAVKREASDADLLLQIASKKLDRLYLALGRSIWRNPLVSPTENTASRVLGGIEYFIAKYGYAPAASAFSAANFDAFLLELDKAGAVISEAWMNPSDLGKFSDLDVSKVQMQREDKSRGTFANQYVSKYGHVLTLNTDPNATPGRINVFSKNDIKLLPLAGRQMQIVDLAKTGDNDKRQLLGEYTIEVRNSALMGTFTPS